MEMDGRRHSDGDLGMSVRGELNRTRRPLVRDNQQGNEDVTPVGLPFLFLFHFADPREVSYETVS